MHLKAPSFRGRPERRNARAGRNLPLPLLLATLAATAGLAVAAAPASAQFNASISGTVTASDNGGAGVLSAAVTVFDVNGNQVGSTFTNANGGYTDNITIFTASLPTTVTVFFGKNGYSDEWYNGQFAAQNATPVPLTSGSTAVTGINATLVPLGGITGTTLQPGESVTLYRANGMYAGLSAMSGNNDVYSITGVQPGTYKLCFMQDCYNGKPAAPAGLASADLISVSAGLVTGNINEQQAVVTHTLTVSEAGAGSGSVTGSGISCPGTCSHSYTASTSVGVTATPASGSTFAGWSGACTGTGACNVTMSADQAVTATFTPTAAGGPSAAQIKALLSSEIVPGGKAAKIKALLKAGAFVELFKALEAGSAVVAWYQLPSGARLATKKTKAKPVLVATGRLKFTAAGNAKLTIKLSPAGKKLLKHAKHVKLTAKGTFAPAGKPAVTTTKTFTLNR